MSVAYDKKEVVGIFRVLRGSHVEGGRIYRARETGNNIVHSKSNLLKHNNPRGPLKFAKVTEEEAAQLETTTKEVSGSFTEEELRALSIDDLRSLAADEEIDLSGVKLKEDIVKTIASCL